MSTLFINGSPNRDGNTAALAKTLLRGRSFETVQLPELKVYPYGSAFSQGDDFEDVLARIQTADTVVIGSPLYWHNICGSVRDLLDRFYGRVQQGGLAGRKLVFLFQGFAPEDWMLEAGEYTMSRFASLYGMEWLGMATNQREAEDLSARL